MRWIAVLAGVALAVCTALFAVTSQTAALCQSWIGALADQAQCSMAVAVHQMAGAAALGCVALLAGLLVYAWSR